MLQNDALWDKGMVHCEICATGLLAAKARYWCVWAQFIWFKWYLDNNGLNDTLTIIILCRVFCYDWPCNNEVRLFVFIRLNTCIVIQYYSYIHDTLLLPYPGLFEYILYNQCNWWGNDNNLRKRNIWSMWWNMKWLFVNGDAWWYHDIGTLSASLCEWESTDLPVNSTSPQRDSVAAWHLLHTQY